MAASAVFLREALADPATGVLHAPSAPSRGQRPVGAPDRLLRRHARTGLKGWPRHLVVACALAAAASTWVPFAELLPGGLLVAAAAVAQRGLCLGLLRKPHAFGPRTWRTALMTAEFVQGAGWIGLALPFLRESAGPLPGGEAFVILAALLLSCVAALARSPLRGAAWAALAPLALVVVLAAALGSGEDAGVLMRACSS